MTGTREELLASVEDEEFVRLFKERTNGLAITPDLSEKVSLLPINEEEAKGIRAQLTSLQKSVFKSESAAANAHNAALAASEVATIAKRTAEGTQVFSDRIIQLEFKLARVLEALAANNITVNLSSQANEEEP